MGNDKEIEPHDRSSSEDGSEAERMPMIDSRWGQSVTRRRAERFSHHFLLVLAALVVSLIVNVISTGLWLWQSSDLDKVCIKHTSAVWSPIMDDIKLTYRPVVFDGSFVNKPLYVQDASPEVDKAWSDLGIDFRTAVVPEARGAEAGIDHSAVKVEAAQGGGYLTNVEVLHHVHCLNMIRQTLPWNVDYYRTNRTEVWENSDAIVRLHVDHCLDTIRQQIQCHSDVGMFGQHWIKREGHDLNVFPIFDTVHMCRNYEDIVTWAKNHQTFDGAIAELRDDDIVATSYP